MSYAITVPPQGSRDISHVVGFIVLVLGGVIAKPKIERASVQRWNLDSVDRKIVSTTFTVLGGAIIGGAAKAIRTYTWDGTKVGLWGGGTAAFFGAALYCCFQSCFGSPAPANPPTQDAPAPS